MQWKRHPIAAVNYVCIISKNVTNDATLDIRLMFTR